MNNFEFDLVYIFLLVRCNNLLCKCPNQNRSEYRNVIQELKRNMNLWKVIDNHELKIFLAQLMLGATRAFEGYDYYYDPEKIFYFKHDPQEDILQSTIIINQFLKDPPNLKPFSKTYLLRFAKNILKNNKASIKVICQREITDEIIDQYFNQTTFIEFTHESQQLAGLSSYHGNITYINNNLSHWKTLITIIHEFGHNISRFLMQKKQICYLSPKHNRDLGYFCHIDQEFKQLEAGNFLEYRLFGIKDNGQGPFGLKKFI